MFGKFRHGKGVTAYAFPVQVPVQVPDLVRDLQASLVSVGFIHGKGGLKLQCPFFFQQKSPAPDTGRRPDFDPGGS